MLTKLANSFRDRYQGNMKAGYLFKQNIRALLAARGQRPHDLAVFCRRSNAWLSKILGKEDRNIPLKYLDRFADFFGIAAYQLFQPGIHPLTNRRSGRERRIRRDRRISQVVASRVLGGRGIEEPVLAALADDELKLIRKFRALSPDEREHLQRVAATAHGPRIDAAKKASPDNRPEIKGPRASGAHRVDRREDDGETRAG